MSDTQHTTASSEPNGPSIEGIPVSVLREYERARLDGSCNMFDINCLRRLAAGLGLFDLVEFIEGNKYTFFNKISLAYNRKGEWWNKDEDVDTVEDPSEGEEL